MTPEVLSVVLRFAAEGATALSFLNILNSKVLGIHGHVTSLNSAMGKIAIGGASIGVGLGMIGAVLATAKGEAEDINKVMTQMAVAGDTLAERQTAYARAWQMTGQVMGKVSENLEAISMLKPQLGLQNAMDLALTYRKNANVLSAVTGEDGSKEAYKLEQAVHMTGRMSVYDKAGNLAKNPDGSEVVNKQGFIQTMNLFTQMVAASRGKISAQQILGFTKQARTSNLQTVSDMGYAHLQGLIQTVGGQRAGTAFNALMNVFEKGMISKMGARQLIHYGLIDEKAVTWGKGPNGVQIAEGGVADTAKLRSDPVLWAWTTLRDHVRDALKRDGKDSSDKAIDMAVKKIKLSNTAGAFVSEGLANQAPDEREAAAVVRASKTNSYKAVQDNSIAGNMKGLHSALTQLKLAFGESVAPLIVPAIRALTGAISGMARFFHDNGALTKAILVTATGIGAALTVFGGIMVTAGITMLVPWAWIPAAILGAAALVAGAVTFLVANWKTVWSTMVGAIKRLWSRGLLNLTADLGKGIEDAIAATIKFLLHGMDMLGGAIINALGTMIQNVIRNIGHWDLGADLKNAGTAFKHAMLGDTGRLEDERKKPAPAAPHPPLPPAPATHVTVVNHTHVNVAGKEIEHVTTKTIHKALRVGQGATGPSSWQPAVGFAAPGAVPRG